MRRPTAVALLCALFASPFAPFGCAERPRPLPPLAPARYDTPVALCETIKERFDLSASPSARRELARAFELLRSQTPVTVTGSVSSPDTFNKRAGMPLLQGEIVAIELTVAFGARRAHDPRESFTVWPFLVFDGARFEGAADDVEDRERKNHIADLIRALFAPTAPPPLGPPEARTTALGGDATRSSFERRDALQKLSLAGYCHGERGASLCSAAVPLARKAPSAGPDVFGLKLLYTLVDREKSCMMVEEREVPLPKGGADSAPVEERLKRLFEQGTIQLTEGTSL